MAVLVCADASQRQDACRAKTAERMFLQTFYTPPLSESYDAYFGCSRNGLVSRGEAYIGFIGSGCSDSDAVSKLRTCRIFQSTTRTLRAKYAMLYFTIGSVGGFDLALRGRLTLTSTNRCRESRQLGIAK